MSSKSGSSRRKPQVVRKVFDTSDEEGEEDMDQTEEVKKKEMNGDVDSDDDVIMNGDSDDIKEVNGDGIPDELPEGTIVVEPEAVEDSNSSFKGPEFPTSKRKSDIGYLSIVTCTCCGKQINTNQPGEARRHPDLRVLVCRTCYKFYKSGPITQDEDGLDEQCRWCSEGGKLFGCDFCNNTFCRSCIVRNLGRSELSVVQAEDSEWKCYMCNPRPLCDLIENCNKVLDKIAKDQEKQKQKVQDSGKKKSAEQTNSKSDSSKAKSESAKGKENKKENDSAVKKKENKKETERKTSTNDTKSNVDNKKPNGETKSLKLQSLLAEPQKTLPLKQPVNQQKIVYVQAPSPQLTAQNILGNGLNTSNVHTVLDKLISVTSSLKLLLSSIRMNIQNDQNNTPDMMLSGIIIENRRKAVECVKSGVDLFLEELRQIEKGTYNTFPGATTVTNLVNPASASPAGASSLLAANLTGGATPYVNIAPKPQQPQIVINFDVAKAVSQLETEKKPEEVKTSNDDASVKTEPEKKNDSDVMKSEPEKMDTSSAENKNESNSTETTETEMKENEMDVKDEIKDEKDVKDETSSKKSSDEAEGNKETTKSDDDDNDENDINENDEKSDSDDSDDESEESSDEDDDHDEGSSGDFEEDWGRKKRKEKKQKGKKEKSSSKKEKKEKKKKDKKEKSKSTKRLSIKFKFGKKDKDEKDESDDNSDDETDKKDKKKSDKSSSKSKENSKKKEKSNDSNSEVSDSDLENEIDKLSKEPSSSKKKKSGGDSKTSEKKKKQEDKKDESDDNSDDETDKKDKKKSDKSSSKSKENSKKKDKSNDSNSEDSDSDLENEIDKLSKEPSSSKKKKSKEDSKTSEKKKKREDKKEVYKDKKKGKKTPNKKADSSSDDDNDDGENEDNNYDDSTEEDKEEIGDLPFDGKDDDDDDDEENKDENVKAKEDLLKELENSSTEDEGSSDSEIVINSPKKKTPKKKSAKPKVNSSDDTDSDISPPKRRKTRSALLEAKISDSDSDFQTPKKKIGKKKRKASSSEEESSEKSESDSDSGSDKKKGKKKGKQAAKGKKGKQKGKQKGRKRRRIKEKSDSSSDGEENGSDEEGDSNDESQTPGGMGKRKKIRKVKSDKKLTDATKEAVKAEEERRKRIEERQKQFNNIEQEVDESSPVKCPTTTKLVLEEDKETKKAIIEVDKGLIRQLKPHQVEAVQFVWDCTMETLERSKKGGAGCILAHCMGLGKTLTLISYIHAMMVNSKKTGISRTLVVCPLNTVLNWQREFEMWQEYVKKEVEVFELSSVKQNFERAQVLQNWHEDGGVMIMGYEMFRILSTGSMCRSKKQKQIFAETLVEPGPDLVVCDEGHILKNDNSSISKAINKVRTKRRVVLTGTPLQNNLVEYHCMVNFVKPNLLGTSKEFRNRFVNPITNGQCSDSTAHDVKIMKRRAHILHEKLAGCVQRKDYSALTKFLPPKHEYVISVRLTKVQVDLYRKYLSLTIGDVEKVSGKGGRLFQDYQNLMRIWTHPWVLKMDEVIKEQKAMFDDDDEFIDDSMSESESEGSASNKSSSSGSEDEVIPVDSDDSGKGRKTRATRRSRQQEKEEKVKEKEKDGNGSGSGKEEKGEEKREVFAGEVVKKWTTRSRGGEDWEEMLKREKEEEENRPLTMEWWAEFVSKEDFNKMELSGKLMLLFEILRMCEEIGDKILVFSQSLLSLDLIEDFLDIVDKKHQEESTEKTDEEIEGQGFGKHWTKGEDYFRMDGSTGPQQRKDMAKSFNDPDNYRARLFLISTKAGSLGINLVGANRVIIFDASWNPSHDVQSIFRVYRFGQTKPVYVYRFLAQATMEEKIYERQIIKLSLSQRVVDEHQVERHFTSQDLQELYIFKPDILDDPDKEERPTPVLPKDHMLAELFKSHSDWIVTYHEHDSLLENLVEEELSEEERKAAWEEYEREGKGISISAQNFMGRLPMQMNPGMQMGYQNMPQMGGMGYPGMPRMPFDGQHLMQLVQEMKAKFPHLPQDQLTARVQGVIRSMLANQIMQHHDVQRRQMEQQQLQHQQQLQQIHAQIRRQQQQMSMQGMRAGMGMNQQPRMNQFGGMQQIRMGGASPGNMMRMNSPGMRTNVSGAGTSSNPINLDSKSPGNG